MLGNPIGSLNTLESMKKTVVRGSAIILAALGVSISLSACTINFGSAGMSGDHSMMDHSSTAGFNSEDLMFAAMMIPHHQQAVDMSNLALEKSSNPEVQALATQIRDAQAPEIEQMQGWLDGSGGASMSDMMAGHDGKMGGMLTDEQMAALQNANGVAFDRLFLEGMIAHHEGAIAMATMITSSSNEEAHELGHNILESQTAEIAKMKELLTQLG